MDIILNSKMNGCRYNETKYTLHFTKYIVLQFQVSTVHHYYQLLLLTGARGGVVFKALCYKPAGRGFDSRWCRWTFSVT